MFLMSDNEEKLLLRTTCSALTTMRRNSATLCVRSPRGPSQRQVSSTSTRLPDSGIRMADRRVHPIRERRLFFLQGQVFGEIHHTKAICGNA